MQKNSRPYKLRKSDGGCDYCDTHTVVLKDELQGQEVNGTDIQAVINVIVDEDYVEKADINKDNKVNGTDIQEIINIIVEEE